MSTNQIDDTTIAMPSDREVVMTHVIKAPRELVYEAYTNPVHIPHWMLGPEGWTMPVCQLDLRPGGTWHFVWRQSDGTAMAMDGEYREVAPPERLVNTESWGGDWPETLNTVEFTEDGGNTTITTRILYKSKEARDAAIGTGMKDGASQSYGRLARYLASKL
ncbi:MAG: SRPBCC family protein [Chloroflexota bacterium]